MGYISPTTPKGVASLPLNPIALAVSLDASFVAQAFAGDIEETKEILKKPYPIKDFLLSTYFNPALPLTKSTLINGLKKTHIILEMTTMQATERWL